LNDFTKVPNDSFAASGETVLVRELYGDLRKAHAELELTESDLQDSFENGPMAMHWVAGDGTILKANKADLNLLGYTAEEYIGQDIADFHADALVIEDIMARLARGEVLQNYPARLKCKDGSLKHVLIDTSVLRRDGKFVHTCCFTRDVTDQVAARTVADRLSAIVESSDDCIVSKDLNGIIQSWNGGAERMFGYTAAEAVGKSIRLIIPEDRQAEEDNVLAHIRRGEKVDHFETVRQRKDGSLIDISLTVSPIKNAQGQVIGASKIARDISDRIRAEKALKESLSMKDQFLGLVSHELRTPIATILGNSQLLLRIGDSLDPADKRQALTDVVNESKRLQGIIENLLILTRLDATRELHAEPVLLPQLVRQVIANFRRQHDRTIVVSEAEDLPVAMGLANLVTQLVENLLSNAHKYSPSTETIEVHLVRNRNGQPEVHVLDRGIGLNSDALELFSPFFRTAQAAEIAPGMGLGLTVCKRIAESLGGGISAQNRDDGGSEFFFWLPPA
jgi:PAS domain S-box-containing protein